MAPLKKLDSTQRRKDTKDAEYHIFASLVSAQNIGATDPSQVRNLRLVNEE